MYKKMKVPPPPPPPLCMLSNLSPPEDITLQVPKLPCFRNGPTSPLWNVKNYNGYIWENFYKSSHCLRPNQRVAKDKKLIFMERVHRNFAESLLELYCNSMARFTRGLFWGEGVGSSCGLPSHRVEAIKLHLWFEGVC